MESIAGIIDEFLDKLRTADWERAEPRHFASVISFIRRHVSKDPTLIGRVSDILGMDKRDITILVDLIEEEVFTSFQWRARDLLGLGANVFRTRDWDLYPRDGFFGDYLEYTLNSEGPVEFHFFAAAAILGGAAKRNFVLRLGHINVWPNIWTVLVAPSGACRKSSTTNIATKLLRELQDFNIITTKSTPEALVEQIRPSIKDSVYEEITGDLDIHYTESQGFISAPELGVFLGKQQYNEGLVQLLTDLSDNPDNWSSGTKRDGASELRHVSLSLLGGITPDWLRDAIPRAAHGGGFMSRILWIYRETTNRVLPYPPPPSPLLRARLIHHLRRVNQAEPCDLVPSEDTLKWFADWYGVQATEPASDARVAGYRERKPTNIWRLATLLTLAGEDHEIIEREGRREATVPLNNVQGALAILEAIEAPQFEAVSIVDSAPVFDDLQRIRRKMAHLSNGKVRVMRSDLMRSVSSFMGKHELDKHLQTLMGSDELECEAEELRGRTVLYYKLGPKFSGPA